MPILNYTTKVAAAKTVGEISALLVAKGASSIHQDYEAGKVKGIAFVLPVGGVPMRFVLPNRTEGVYRVMRGRSRGRSVDKDQAERVAWRIVKDWVAAQLAMVESGMAEMGQVFMPYAEIENGQTVYEMFVDRNQKQLGTGK